MEKSNFRVILIILSAIIIVPILNSVYGLIPAFVTGLAALIAVVVIILFFFTRTKSKPISKGICEDITGIDINVNGRNYIINSGTAFNTDDHEHQGVLSYIENGIWHISDDPANTLSGMTAEITVPENRTLNSLNITARTGNVLINAISAKSSNVSVSDGYVQMNGLSAKELIASVGKGSLIINASLDGNAQLRCGSGELKLSLNNRKDLYTINATVGNGTISVDNEEVFNSQNRGGMINENAEYKIDAQCGLGKLNIDFAEVATDDED